MRPTTQVPAETGQQPPAGTGKRLILRAVSGCSGVAGCPPCIHHCWEALPLGEEESFPPAVLLQRGRPSLSGRGYTPLTDGGMDDEPRLWALRQVPDERTVQGFSDAGWEGCESSGKSRSGWCIHEGNVLVQACTRRQRVVALNNCKSKIYAPSPRPRRRHCTQESFCESWAPGNLR